MLPADSGGRQAMRFLLSENWHYDIITNFFLFLYAAVGCSSSLSVKDHVGSSLAVIVGEYIFSVGYLNLTYFWGFGLFTRSIVNVC